MSATLTIRLPDPLRHELESRAAAQTTSVSELVRSILEEAVRTLPLAERAGELRGRLAPAEDDDDAWGAQIRQRNWRR